MTVDGSKICILITLMAVLTYLPRAIPAVLVDKLKFGPKINKFLNLIPYTAMAALIFPGVFTVDSDNYAIGIVGVAAAALLAWRKCPVMVCVLAAIAVDFALYMFVFPLGV